MDIKPTQGKWKQKMVTWRPLEGRQAREMTGLWRWHGSGVICQAARVAGSFVFIWNSVPR